jgi:hypothetical protein
LKTSPPFLSMPGLPVGLLPNSAPNTLTSLHKVAALTVYFFGLEDGNRLGKRLENTHLLGQISVLESCAGGVGVECTPPKEFLEKVPTQLPGRPGKGTVQFTNEWSAGKLTTRAQGSMRLRRDDHAR